MPLTKDMPASAWIHDFVKSDNPKFRGKSKEERRKQALGAYYAAQRNEEVEQIDEKQDWVWSYKPHKKNLERVSGHWGILHDRGFSGKKTYHVGHISHDNKFFHSGTHATTGESKFHPTFDSSHEAKKYIKANKDTYKPHAGPWLEMVEDSSREKLIVEAITPFKMPSGEDVPGHQGHDPDHEKHPLHATLVKHGYKYSHSTPIHYRDGVRIHHTYKAGEFSPNGHYTDHHNVGVEEGSTKWETSRGSATGRHHVGSGEASLDKHLKSKKVRYKELRESLLEGYYVVHYKVPGKGKDAKPSKMLRVVKAETEDHARKAHSDEMGKQEHSVSHVSRLQEDFETIQELVEQYPTYGELKGALIQAGVSDVEVLDDLTEEIGTVGLTLTEAKDHPVPHLGKWNMYAGGTAGAGKHSYDHHLDDGEAGKPASHTQYTIDPVSHSNGRFSHYRVGAWSPKAGHAHKELGRVRNPNEGVKLARKHYDEHFGGQVNEELINEAGRGRPSQQHPLEGHDYHKKSEAELRYIQKDAGEAAEAMRGHNVQAENKYVDQAHDAGTVMHFRRQHGASEVHQMPTWYQKKYGPKKEMDEAFVVRGDKDGYNVVNSETGKVVSRSHSWTAAHLSKKSLAKSLHREEAEIQEEMKTLDEAIDHVQAHEILKAVGIPRGTDYYTLSPSKVTELLDHARKHKYYKPKNANASRGRYFHDMLQRKARHSKLSEEQITEKELSVPEKHQLKIAKDTMKMNPIMAKVMGGMSHEEAKALLKKHGIPVKEEVEQIDEKRERKTEDEWQLHVHYGQGWEHEISEKTHKEIRQRAKEYRENAPQYPTKIVYKRVKKEPAEHVAEGEIKMHPSMSKHIAAAMIKKLTKKKEMVKEDVTGPTRMQMQNYFQKHTGPTQREKLNATEKAFNVKNIKVNSKGEIVSHDKN